MYTPFEGVYAISSLMPSRQAPTCGNATAHRVSSLQLRTYRWGGCTHPRYSWSSVYGLDTLVHTSWANSTIWYDKRTDMYTALITPAVSMSAVHTFCSIFVPLRQIGPFMRTRRVVLAGSRFVAYTFILDLRLFGSYEPTVCTRSSLSGRSSDARVHDLLRAR